MAPRGVAGVVIVALCAGPAWGSPRSARRLYASAAQTDAEAPPLASGGEAARGNAPAPPDRAEGPPLVPPPRPAPAHLSLVPVPELEAPPPSAHRAALDRGLGLRVAGWTLIGLGGAATVAGALLLPLRPADFPLTTGVVPVLAGGAALLLTGRMLLTFSETRR